MLSPTVVMRVCGVAAASWALQEPAPLGSVMLTMRELRRLRSMRTPSPWLRRATGCGTPFSYNSTWPLKTTTSVFSARLASTPKTVPRSTMRASGVSSVKPRPLSPTFAVIFPRASRTAIGPTRSSSAGAWMCRRTPEESRTSSAPRITRKARVRSLFPAFQRGSADSEADRTSTAVPERAAQSIPNAQRNRTAAEVRLKARLLWNAPRCVEGRWGWILPITSSVKSSRPAVGVGSSERPSTSLRASQRGCGA